MSQRAKKMYFNTARKTIAEKFMKSQNERINKHQTQENNSDPGDEEREEEERINETQEENNTYADDHNIEIDQNKGKKEIEQQEEITQINHISTKKDTKKKKSLKQMPPLINNMRAVENANDLCKLLKHLKSQPNQLHQKEIESIQRELYRRDIIL